MSRNDDTLLVQVISNRTSCACPVCATPSEALHSLYRRHPLELPCAGQRVQLALIVHKFFCRVSTCPQKVFTERLPELLQPYSRLTTRLRSLLQAIGLAFNGQGGARLSKRCGINISRVTLLRSLQLLPEPATGQVRMVGVDDFAWKRGKRYGIVIIDLETQDGCRATLHRKVLAEPCASPASHCLANDTQRILDRTRSAPHEGRSGEGRLQQTFFGDRPGWHSGTFAPATAEELAVRLRAKPLVNGYMCYECGTRRVDSQDN